eukprot:6180906-Pleurochrysis_carterae.AAC.1
MSSPSHANGAVRRSSASETEFARNAQAAHTAVGMSSAVLLGCSAQSVLRPLSIADASVLKAVAAPLPRATSQAFLGQVRRTGVSPWPRTAGS